MSVLSLAQRALQRGDVAKHSRLPVSKPRASAASQAVLSYFITAATLSVLTLTHIMQAVMLATKVSRAVQRACPTNAIPGTILAASTTRGTHQRRRSSSKASCPPDDSSKPAPTAKAAVEENTSQPIRKRASKYRRLGDKAVKTKREEYTLPSVPDVQHLEAKDISFSSFFSLHRPLSLTSPFPPSVTEEAFNAIFDKAEQDPWANGNSAERRPEDVIYALSQTIESLESEASQDGVVHIDVLTEGTDDGPARHLDSLPKGRMASLEETVAQYQPFKAPPPPQAFTSSLHQDKKRQPRQRTRTKSYTTTIVVTESMDSEGKTSYEASLSPIVQLPEPTSQAQSFTPMRQRKSLAAVQRAGMSLPSKDRRTRTMRLIGIRKRRALKMKKHKLKKLRRRDRAQKRRQENR